MIDEAVVSAVFPEWTGSMPKWLYAIVTKAPTGETTAKGKPSFKTYVHLFATKDGYQRHLDLLRQPGMMSTGFGDMSCKTFIGRVEWDEGELVEPTPWKTEAEPMPMKKGGKAA